MDDKLHVLCRDITGDLLHSFIWKLDALKIHLFSSIKKQISEIVSYSNKLVEEVNCVQEFLKKKDDKVLTAEEKIELYNLGKLKSRMDANEYSQYLIPNGVVVSIVSIFDYYIHSLLKLVCEYLGENFHNNISLNYKEIRSFETAEEIKDYCIEKYLEDLFYGSHSELFKKLKNEFSIDVMGTKHYKNFLFITELRNIIVHNDAKISIAFKNKMEDNHDYYKDYNIIDSKGVVRFVPENINFVFEEIIYMASYIALVICSHYGKKNDKARRIYLWNINDIALEYLDNGYANISIDIFDDLIANSNNSEEEFTFKINKCCCLKKLNRLEDLKEVLGTLDWSNCDKKYLFAKDCLLKNYEGAISFLKKQDDKEEWALKLQIWPLCKDLVKSDVFINDYPNIFGKPYEKKIKDWKNTKEDLLSAEKYISNIIQNSKKNKNS